MYTSRKSGCTIPSMLPIRFMKALFKSLWGEVLDRTVEILFPIAGLVYYFSTKGLSWSRLWNDRREILIIGVWVFSALVAWHAFRTADAVVKEIREENARAKPTHSRILSSSGQPIDAGTEICAYFGTKLYGIALCLTVLAI